MGFFASQGWVACCAVAAVVAGCSSARPAIVAVPGASTAARAPRAPVPAASTTAVAPPQRLAAPPVPPLAHAPGVTAAQGAGPELSGFGKALLGYSTWVDQFAVLPVDLKSDALHQAFDSLADAVEVLPLSGDLVPAQVAANLKTLSANFQSTPALTPRQTTIARDLFDRTQSFLSLAAQQIYARAPAVADAVNVLRLTYQSMDTSKPLDQQLAVALACLDSIQTAFRAMALAASESQWTRTQPATPP